MRKAVPGKPTFKDGRELSDEELETAAGGTTGLGVAGAAALGAAAGGSFLTGLTFGLGDD